MLAATPENIRAARERAGLTQAAAAALVYLGRSDRWSECERGLTDMDPARWELFCIKTGMHPEYKNYLGAPAPALAFSPALAR